ncbi:MAG: SRPBCC family protein [Pseudomonadales bacterium]|jgi:carbon monoxide dehydrogenase subunit G|nr:SRPBCC family protein [Pseudomonadales bacterium]
MAQAKVVQSIKANADDVWQILGNFKSIQPGPGIDSVVYEGEGVGMTRTISTPNGDVVERLDVYEPSARQFAYAITNDGGPLPFADYSAVVAVNDNDDGTTTVEWTGTFEPRGVDEETAVKFATGIYTRAIDGARTVLEG